MRKVCVINYKGGTGKTCTVVNLAHGLAMEGKRVLVIDTDPQGSSGYHLGVNSTYSLYDLLVEDISYQECIVNARENVDIITANERLFPAEMALTKMPNREMILKRKLAGLTEDYDIVLVDCAPSINLMNQNALLYAEEIFLPVSMEYLSLVGIKQLLNNIKIINKIFRHGVRVTKLIPTFYDKRNAKSKRIVDSLSRVFKAVMTMPIRSCVSISEAAGCRKTIFEYDSKSNGAIDYKNLASEVLNYG